MTVCSERAPGFEPLDERALVQSRLEEVEAYAASPTEEREGILFLASVEREFGISMDPDFGQLASPSPTPPHQQVLDKLRGRNIHLIPAEVQQLTESERRAKLQATKADARELVLSLQPDSHTELTRQAEWYADIDNFNLVDAINFRLYQEFSVPTLSSTAVPRSATYQQVEDYGQQHGWVEFRFGTGTLQSGYYDGQNTCELRTTPCPPTELVAREEIIQRRLADIAAEYGCVLLMTGRHINLSAYREDVDGVVAPILGNAPEHRATALDATAGIAAAMEDGAWLSQAQAAEVLHFHRESARGFSLSPHRREHLRLLQDHIELREDIAMPSTAHGLLWLMSGVTHGLEEGWGSIAAQGYEVPMPASVLSVRRTEIFDKERHLHIQRALQHSKLTVDGRLALDSNYNLHRSTAITQSLIGSSIFGAESGPNFTFNNMAVSALRLDEQGILHCSADDLRQAYDDMLDISQQEVEYLMLNETTVAALAKRVDDNVKAVRLESDRYIEGDLPFIGLSPNERRQKLAGSAVMRMAYGMETEAYINLLARTAQVAYDAIDLETALRQKLEQLGGSGREDQPS